MESRETTSLSKRVTACAAVAFWLVVWHIAARVLNQPILLVSPIEVLVRIVELVQQGSFWASIATSVFRIALGFILAFVLGLVLAAVSHTFQLARTLIAPVIVAVRAAPVASFIILVLVWVSSRELATVIAFMMAFPMVYINVLAGLDATPQDLIEMADVFSLPLFARVRSIYLSSSLPYVRGALQNALGFSWKAGVAAEVIGLPAKSIGEQLYNAKIFLDTGGVLAWTVVIIALSLVFEQLFVRTLDALVARIEAGD